MQQHAASTATNAPSAAGLGRPQDETAHINSSRFGWRYLQARLSGQAMASSDGRGSQQPQSNGLELSRMERVDASSQDGSEVSETASSGEKDSRSKFAKAVSSAEGIWPAVWAWIKLHSNFYRIHLLTFTIVPLIASGIFYAVDSGGHRYINCLTLCTSAMTVTGLSPILMESISHVQQAIIYFLQCIGNIMAVSIVTIVIRRHFFRKRFEHMVKTDPRARRRIRDAEYAHQKEKEGHNWMHPFGHDKHDPEKQGHNGIPDGRFPGVSRSHSATDDPIHSRAGTPSGKPKKRKRDKLRVDMIRRVDAPVKVNQMNVGGFLSENGGPNRRGSLDSASGSQPYTLHPEPHGDVLEKTATRTDSPTQMSPPPDTPRINEEPPSPRGIRRVSLAELPAPRHERVLSDNNQMGTIQEASSRPASIASSVFEDSSDSSSNEEESAAANATMQKSTSALETSRSRRMSDPAHLPSHTQNTHLKREFKRVRTMDPPKPAGFVSHSQRTGGTFPRTQTIEIREPAHPDRPRGYSSAIPHVGTHGQPDMVRRRAATSSTLGPPLSRTMARRGSVDPMPRTMTRGTTSMTTGFGGFPNPLKIAAGAAQKRLLTRVTTLDMPRTTTLQSVYSDRGNTNDGGLSNISGGPTRAVSYISFDAVVGRNSRFYSLTSAQRDELGGVEYRALSTLLKIVVAYFIGVQVIFIVILAPIFQSNHYAWLFREQDQGTLTNAGGWYVVFNLMSGFSNSGLSLLDDSMVPFQRSYAYVLVMAFCILAGNTAFPVFLRLIIWLLSKVARQGSRFAESTQFLLDHPRRCFIYLFPTHQTWFLVAMLVVLNSTDWICFIVLDIGNEILEALPPAAKAIDGLFQGVAVRAAGFSIVPLAETAPALQFLYVVMMYLAVFPLALSIRSTNVYEEKSMGLYEEEDGSSEIEAEYNQNHSIGSYFAHHARKQLAFDIWWLGLAIWAICIVERANLVDPETDSYFNVFTIMFEVVSAYGTVGLSLGTPTAAYSLSGDFRTLSKLILCAVMVRGRHRGLPVAIDRSILLPSDLEALQPPPVDEAHPVTEVDTVDGSGFSSLDKGQSRSNTVGIQRKRTRTGTTSSYRYSGGQPTRRMRSGASATSRGSGSRKEAPQASPSVQIGPLPTMPVKRPTPSRPTLNGFLSTIYSENPTPAGTPNDELQENLISSDDISSTAQGTGTASTSSGDTSGKEAIVSIEKSDEK